MAFSPISQALALITKALSPVPRDSFKAGSDKSHESTGLLKDLQAMGLEDYKTLSDMVSASVSGEDDDNSLLMERLITLLSKLPEHSRDGQLLTDNFVNTLWGALEHPPAGHLGKSSIYREADGSNNNPARASMGSSGMPYARTTPATAMQVPNLPDPGLIFDSIMDRDAGPSFKEHPNKISSMFFYLAIILTHDVFETNVRDPTINMSSSYLDLSPLYGRNTEELKAMRTFKNGFLKPDCFSSKKIMSMPPGAGAFLIMFNRFHNYVVSQLALINEGGRFNKPDSRYGGWAAWEKYDNDLFQTARLITCGLYVNIILKDYVRTILNLNRSGSLWDLDPRTQEKKSALNGQPAAQATGNQISVEFNLLYRWHSALSSKDEAWTEQTLRKKLGGLDPTKASLEEVMAAMARYSQTVPNEPESRDYFTGLSRDDDGTYPDDELVSILTSSIEDVAGAFGAFQVPRCLRTIEILGIVQAREWNVATLNEFRQHFQLKRHDTFEEINPDPKVAANLRALYDSPDAVELYPGLLAEKTKPPMVPGSGLCVNYTTSRSILSDAVTLVRGDRFYTTDYTPRNLTNWGYNEADFDLSVNQGHVMHKLIFRAFPNHFEYNSIYAHFPFVVPSENKVILEALDTAEQYSWAKPARKIDPVVLKSHKTTTQVLSNNKDFYVPWGQTISYLVTPPKREPAYARQFCLSGDGPPAHASRDHVRKCLYAPSNWNAEIAHFYQQTTTNFLHHEERRVLLPGGQQYEADIVRDVINPLNTRFIAAFFGMPIKTAETPHGIFTEFELYNLLTAMFASVFFDSDPANSFKLKTTARKLALQLEKILVLETEANSKAGWVSDVAARIGFGGSPQKDGSVIDEHGREWPTLPSYGKHLVSRMMEKGKTIEECIASTVVPMSAAGATILSGLLSQCLDYFLGDGSKHLPELYRLAHEDSEEADELLTHYAMEGIRLRGTVVLARYVPPTSEAQTVTDTAPCLANPADPQGPSPIPNPHAGASERTYTIPPGGRAIIDLVSASHDASAFPDPETLKVDRPLEDYLPWGFGPHKCLGDAATRTALVTAFKGIVALPGLTRAPGPRGHSKNVEFKEWRGQIGRKAVEGGGDEWTGLRAYMRADESGFWPVPSTMRVRWNAKDSRGRPLEPSWVDLGEGIIVFQTPSKVYLEVSHPTAPISIGKATDEHSPLAPVVQGYIENELRAKTEIPNLGLRDGGFLSGGQTATVDKAADTSHAGSLDELVTKDTVNVKILGHRDHHVFWATYPHLDLASTTAAGSILLRQRTLLFIHNAAHVHWIAPYKPMMRSNVLSTID